MLETFAFVFGILEDVLGDFTFAEGSLSCWETEKQHPCCAFRHLETSPFLLKDVSRLQLSEVALWLWPWAKRDGRLSGHGRNIFG